MVEKKKLHLTVLNRYYPPSHSITGESAFELVQFINENSENIKTSSISIETNYKKNKIDRGTINPNSHFIKSIPDFNNKVLRFLINFFEGYRLVKKAVQIESDVIIVMTDPPLLNFWASKLLKRKKWFLWSMDIYPEAFVSAKLVSSKNPFIKYFKSVLKDNPPNYLIALGQKQKEYLLKTFGQKPETFILPCGIHNELRSNQKPVWANQDLITFAYAGNIGEAHSSRFLKNFIESLDKSKHQVILALYGAKAAKTKLQITASPNIIFVNRVEKNEFDFVDIHLVSLLPKWTNICVPSKAVSAVCSSGTFLFYGSKDSDTYNMFQSSSWTIPYEIDERIEIRKIREFLKNVNKEKIRLKKENAAQKKLELNQKKRKTFSKILEAIEKYSN